MSTIIGYMIDNMLREDRVRWRGYLDLLDDLACDGGRCLSEVFDAWVARMPVHLQITSTPDFAGFIREFYADKRSDVADRLAELDRRAAEPTTGRTA